MDHRTLLLRSALLLLSGLTVTWVALSAATDSGAAHTGTDEPSERGDVDKDGDVDSIDALVILRDIAGLGKLEFPDDADVDGDGDIDVTDALHILRFVAGLAPLPGAPPPTQTPTAMPTATATATPTPTATPECSPWPPEVSIMLESLPVVEGLCLIRLPGPSGTAYYDAALRAAVCPGDCSAPVGGEIAALTHEVCHAHQHRVVLDAGLPEPGGLLSLWVETPEGRDFVEQTGWHLEDGTWIEAPEPGFSGHPNPLEDAAQVCVFWYDDLYDIVEAYEQGYLRDFGPIRYRWAQQWLPP